MVNVVSLLLYEVYNTLDAAGKNDFLKEFQVRGKVKNLDWRHNFIETHVRRKTEQSSVKKNFLTACFVIY